MRAPPAGDRRATGGAPKTARRIREAGAAGPATGAFSTLLRQSGLRASTGGVLATKSERKMLASTCLYSLYAWFILYLTCLYHLLFYKGHRPRHCHHWYYRLLYTESPLRFTPFTRYKRLSNGLDNRLYRVYAALQNASITRWWFKYLG